MTTASVATTTVTVTAAATAVTTKLYNSENNYVDKAKVVAIGLRRQPKDQLFRSVWSNEACNASLKYHNVRRRSTDNIYPFTTTMELQRPARDLVVDQ